MTREETSRYKYLETRAMSGELLYPYDFKKTMSIKVVLLYVKKPNILPDTPTNSGVLHNLTLTTGGRVLAIRSIGKIFFIKIESGGQSLQII